jgi:L-ascorbate metabolism protein UlaG (beta-lactamase superfamily)
MAHPLIVARHAGSGAAVAARATDAPVSDALPGGAVGDDRVVQVCWWGHSTVGLELAGVRLLTDPVLTHSVAHLRRRRGPRPAPRAVDVDAVLVSHLHADHFHVPSLRLLGESVRLFVPLGGAGVLRASHAPDLADRCEELAPGTTVTIAARTATPGAELEVTTAAAAHDDRRAPWSRHRGPALEFLISSAGPASGEQRRTTVWFPGDTDLRDGLDEIGPVDLGLVPVGGWGPNLGDGHLDPGRAAEATRRVQARAAIPIHYGTLWPRGLDAIRPHLFLPPGAEYAARCAATCPDTAVHVLDPGGGLTLPTPA